jgi:hypothetical protein
VYLRSLPTVLLQLLILLTPLYSSWQRFLLLDHDLLLLSPFRLVLQRRRFGLLHGRVVLS